MSDVTPAYFRNSNDSWLDELVGAIIDAELSNPNGKDIHHWDYESTHTPESPFEVAVWLDSQTRSLRGYREDEACPQPVRSRRPPSSCSTKPRSSPKSIDSRAFRSKIPVPTRKSSKSISDGRASIWTNDSPDPLPKKDLRTSSRVLQAGEKNGPQAVNTWTPQLEPVSSVVKNLASALQAISNEEILQRAANSFQPDPTLESQAIQALPQIEHNHQPNTAESPTRLSTSTEQIISGKLLQLSCSPDKVDQSTQASLPINFRPHPAVRPLSTVEESTDIESPSNDSQRLTESTSARMLTIGLYLIALIVSIDRVALTTAIPRISEAFGSYHSQAWYGSAYLLLDSVAQPLYNRIYTSFNTKWTFLVALIIFGIGSLISGFASSAVTLVWGRGIQGVGSAGALAGCSIVAHESKILSQKFSFLSGFHVMFGIGALAGPLLGGVFADEVTWRWTFWINLPVTATGFIVVALFFTPSTAAPDSRSWLKRIIRLDLVGAFVLIIANVMLFFALQLSIGNQGWNNSSCIGLLSGFCVAVIAFFLWLMYRGEQALIPLRIICYRNVAVSCFTAFLIYGSIFVHAFYLPMWFQFVQGSSAVQSGVNVIPYFLFSTIFYFLAGAFVSRYGMIALPAGLGTAIGSIGAGLLATINRDSNTGTLIGYEIIVSIGIGMAVQHGFVAVQAALNPEDVSIATAAVVGCQSLGGALFIFIANTIFQSKLLHQTQAANLMASSLSDSFKGSPDIHTLAKSGYQPSKTRISYSTSLQPVFIIAVALCVCTFFCSLLIGGGWKMKERPKDQGTESTA